MFGILRFFLALFVVLLHVFNVPKFGNYALHTFFVLSGFLMTLIVNEKYGFTLKGFKSFWFNRFLRIYPSYWIVISLTFILLYFFGEDITLHSVIKIPNDLSNTISNIILIYPHKVPSRIAPRLSSPSWALTNELLFYMLISLGISKNKRRTILWFFIGLCYMIFSHYFRTQTYRYASLFSTSFLFSFGAMLYYFKDKIRKSYLVFRVMILSVLYVLLCLLNSYTSKDIEYHFFFYTNIVLSGLLIVYLFKLKPNQFLKKLDVFFGNLSFPMYIGHFLMVIVYCLVTNYGVKQVGFKLEMKSLVIYLPFLILFSYLLHYLIEQPIARFKK